ncbi:hypothetical protein GJAV_G00113840 [Gymnothorax javanicus]|nr:hypothetical protein GJAV_G00113840 [Gymnothorax javanicus]
MNTILKCTMLVMLLACGGLSTLRRPSKHTVTCCKEVSPQPITSSVTGYKRQNALDPCVQAIIFYTAKGPVCSSPGAPWVHRKMKGVPETV